jgi:hypothetical protein
MNVSGITFIRELKIKSLERQIILIIIIVLSNKHPYMFVTRKKQKQKNNVNKISQFIMNKLRDFCPQF